MAQTCKNFLQIQFHKGGKEGARFERYLKVQLNLLIISPSFVKRGLGGDLNDIKFRMRLELLLPNLPLPLFAKEGD